MSINFKAKGNAAVSVLACNVLMMAFQDEDAWPESFVKATTFALSFTVSLNVPCLVLCIIKLHC